jgi:phosphodiesterase/alkaline phosphatase D-like protein
MTNITRRSFLEMAFAISVTAAWGNLPPLPSRVSLRERRDLFPEGVASGDPDSSSVLLWTRYPQPARTAETKLNLIVSRASSQSRLLQSLKLLIGPVGCSSVDSNRRPCIGIALPAVIVMTAALGTKHRVIDFTGRPRRSS